MQVITVMAGLSCWFGKKSLPIRAGGFNLQFVSVPKGGMRALWRCALCQGA